MKPQVVSVDDLASHWSLTPRRVRMLAEEIPIPHKGGKFDLLEADRLYITWLQRDEPTRRSKRELMAWQRQRIEAAIAREDRKTMQPAEVQKYVDDAWEALRRAHVAGLNALHGTVSATLGPEKARQYVSNLEQRVNGEMSVARDALSELLGCALEEMESETRNGLITCTRRITCLSAALGEDSN